MSAPQIDVHPDAEQLARDVAERIITWMDETAGSKQRFTIAFAGGSTPKTLYRLLASDDYRGRIDWRRIEAFWGDERYVPLDHEDSNFRMTRENLLDHVDVPEGQIHPVPTDLEPDAAAHAYEQTMRATFEIGEGEIPRFELILLGIGPDGHTASLFPETEALDVHDRLVIENWVPQQDSMRITFTIPVLHQAHRVVLMAAGQDKADAIARAIEAPQNLNETPSQCLRDAQGDVMMILEHQAASQLSSES